MAKYIKPINKYIEVLNAYHTKENINFRSMGTGKLSKHIIGNDKRFMAEFGHKLPDTKYFGAIIREYRKIFLKHNTLTSEDINTQTTLDNKPWECVPLDNVIPSQSILNNPTINSNFINGNGVDEEPFNHSDYKIDTISDDGMVDVEYNDDIDAMYDTYISGTIERDEPKEGQKNGRINGYRYEIQQRDKIPLYGVLTREEMQLIMSKYSGNEGGANLPRKAVSRYLPKLSFHDLCRIMRAFGITKASLPFAPHLVEEHTPSELSKIADNQKETNVLEQLDKDQSRYYKNAHRKVLKELKSIKGDYSFLDKSISKLISGLMREESKPIRLERSEQANECALMIHLSDWHIGSKVGRNALYPNKWDESEMYNRLYTLLDEIKALTEIHGVFDRIIINSLGDMIDGQDGKTTRGLSGGSSHVLPQNMDSRQQLNNFTNMMKDFISNIHEMKCANNIDIYFVPDSNHGGVLEYAGALTVREYCKWKYPDVNCIVFEKFLSHYKYGIHTYVINHGKDEQFMRVGLPFVLNDKYELLINRYLDHNQIFGNNVHVVKGDLHRSAYQKAKRFTYKNVCSGYGSSEWIMMNFGEGYCGCDMEIVYKNKPRTLETHLAFKPVQQ